MNCRNNNHYEDLLIHGVCSLCKREWGLGDSVKIQPLTGDKLLTAQRRLTQYMPLQDFVRLAGAVGLPDRRFTF